MFEQRITQNFAFGVETDKHFQIATEAHRSTLDSSTEVITLSVLNLIDGECHFLAFGIVLLYLVSLCHLEVVACHNSLDAVCQCLFLLLCDGTLSEMVHISENTTHDDCYQRQYQHHIH